MAVSPLQSFETTEEERRFWIEMRRGLVQQVRAIERRYKLIPFDQEKLPPPRIERPTRVAR